MIRDTALAVSSSDETMKSTSSWRSRHTSRYSSLVVRTIVLVSGARFREKIAAIRLISSRDVHEIIRSDSSRPASWSVLRLAPFPSIVATS